MSKTIEFVEQNICECKKHIQYLNDKINEYKKYPSFVKDYKERIEELKPILQNLEQIKCELEAWEVVKEDIEYSEVQPCEERPEYTYEFKKWIFEINEEQGDFEEKNTKLKKALELNNEN